GRGLEEPEGTDAVGPGTELHVTRDLALTPDHDGQNAEHAADQDERLDERPDEPGCVRRESEAPIHSAASLAFVRRSRARRGARARRTRPGGSPGSAWP